MSQKNATSILTCVLACFVGSNVCAQPVANAAPEDISPLIERVITAAHIPGAVAVVLRGDRVLAEGAAGVRRRGSDVAVTLDDQFEIASCTKAMTTSLVADLVAEQRLTWDTTIGDLWADSPAPIDSAWHDVTVSQLLRHRSGARDRLGDFIEATRDGSLPPAQQRQHYVAKVLARAPESPPGKTFHYNNTNYLIVAAALDRLTGQPTEDLLRARVFGPLGMASAGFGPPGTPGKIDQPWGHGPRWIRYLPIPFTRRTAHDPGSPQADFPLAAGPAGMVHISVRDWATFATAHLRGDAANPHHTNADRGSRDYDALHTANDGEDYALGWYVGTRSWAKGKRPEDTGRILHHQGDNGRWNCVIYLAPEIDFAVLVACNQAGMASPVDDIAGSLVWQFASVAAD